MKTFVGLEVDSPKMFRLAASRFVWVMALLFGTLPRGLDGQTAVLSLPGDWEVGTPASVGIDGQVLTDVSRRAANGEFGQVNSLLVVRGGKLVFEEYYRGWGIFQIHTIQSLSKSVTSLLVGIAIGEGLIKSVDQRVSDFFPEYRAIFDQDPRKQRLTLRNVLTMTFGNDWKERAIPYSNPANIVWRMAAADDWMGFILGQPMVEEPGARFNYSTGSALLLSGILQHATGMHVSVYAEQRLFDPLSIPVYGWYRNMTHPQRWTHTGGGLGLRSRDLAKIGYLLVSGGRWNGKQVVPAAWIEESTRPHVQADTALWYGYQWWLQSLPNSVGSAGAHNEVIEGRGYGGQYVVAVPRLDLVVAVTSGSFEDETEARRALTMVLQHVLPAVKQLR
ncbi:MAG TPA: serine hydrolase [Terriglobales bacterium]